MSCARVTTKNFLTLPWRGRVDRFGRSPKRSGWGDCSSTICPPAFLAAHPTPSRIALCAIRHSRCEASAFYNKTAAEGRLCPPPAGEGKQEVRQPPVSYAIALPLQGRVRKRRFRHMRLACPPGEGKNALRHCNGAIGDSPALQGPDAHRAWTALPSFTDANTRS
jgi:hypothetical protein